MKPPPVIAIFDIGKTNKKVFLFDEDYNIVFTKVTTLPETVDEDGFPCENIKSLCDFVFGSLKELFSKSGFEIKAINFSAYGASLVYMDGIGNVLTPLYNYLKPYPAELQEEFYEKHGGEIEFSRQTASPVLGSLNAGLQLYRLKKEQPLIFYRLKYALHLPQYLSWLISGIAFSDITSIGCHTALWDFQQNDYHKWLQTENMLCNLAPLVISNTIISVIFKDHSVSLGVGLHDSSAALIPYQISFPEPFMFISTGTWSITLNPFNEEPLSTAELNNDCLRYFSYSGKPVKASRLLLGFEHDEQVKKIALHFNKDKSFYKTIEFDASILIAVDPAPFAESDLYKYASFETAYHYLVANIIRRQYLSSSMVLSKKIRRIFVDGGFSRNEIYMHLLANAFPDMEVYAATIPEASAIGVALVIHQYWNDKTIPADLIRLKRYAPLLNI